ncbi:homoserine O-succinyltransferase [Bradyrhizobium sp. Tv2a-2]|uniref:homoserine O-succinyltransferase MetA n=1 Tax=Bradyrhizobium sp. Tv2a-2 TaxID=113395 RepID=UPI0004176734|nr:homoserine O-succinyltransferase [Bradyrhizobium sp. Tv2a-2]
MILLFDKKQSIASPTLAPGQDAFDHGERSELTIGLVNNMPDSALKPTERQFSRLLSGAAGQATIHFHFFSLPSVNRSSQARAHIEKEYSDIADLGRLKLDGLIVTGAEPNGCTLPQETLWRELTDIIDWAKINTRSTIWSCLAAHAAVLHLDGIERQRLPAKCSGVQTCIKATDDWLTRGLRGPLKVPHSRLNEVRESDLVNRGYRVLTRSNAAGVDIFAKQFDSRFIFFQGHPEYDALSLQREYMRDLARYLAGEREDYPAIPASYFDAATEAQLTSFEKRARSGRDPTLAAELPGLTLRVDIAAGVAAHVILRNWLAFLGRQPG